MRHVVSLLLLASSAVAQTPPSAWVAIRAGRLIDGLGGTPLANATVLIEGGRIRDITQEELDALVDEARAWGRRVAAHAHGAEGIIRAVRAGVVSIDHGTFSTKKGRGSWWSGERTW